MKTQPTMNLDPQTKWIIVDLDGTVCDIAHRLHFLRGDKLKEMHSRTDPDWDGFNCACIADPPKEHIIAIVQALRMSKGWRVLIVTGRSEKYRHQTMSWLEQNHVPYDCLLMRPLNDFSPDIKVKSQLFVDFVLKVGLTKQQFQFALEDRDSVVEMWRSIGINCLQVEKGAY